MFEKYIAHDNLVRFPMGKERIYLGLSGRVLDSFGNEITPIDGKIWASLWDGPKWYIVLDLLAITFKNVHLPPRLWGEIEGFCIDGDLANRHPSNIGYRFRNGPLENYKFPGYYYIPMYTQYCISKEGVMINHLIGKPNNVWYKSKKPNRKNIKGGYFYKNLRFDGSNKWMNAPRHRLLAYAFLRYPNNVDELDVNHVDGVPGNDDLSNLEWTTRSQNNYHAIALGMKTAHRVISKHVLTGEIIEHASVCQCAKYFGYPTDETIRFRLYKQPFGKVYSDGCQFKLGADPREFPIIDDPIVEVKNAQRSNPVLVKDLSNDTVTKYQTSRAAALVVGLKRATLQYRLTKDVGLVMDKYIFKYEDDERTWEELIKVKTINK